MKKIAIITQYWKNSQGGGGKTHMTGFVAALEEKGIKPSVIFSQGQDASQYSIRGNRFLFPFKALWLLKKIKPQVINSRGTWYCLFPGYLYKLLFGAKLIHTFHSTPRDSKLTFFSQLFLQILINKCDNIVFVSEGLKKEFENYTKLKFKRNEVIHAGITASKPNEKEILDFRNKYCIDKNSIVLLSQAFTVNILKSEGVKIVIQAISTLIKDYPQIKLILTRNGAYCEELNEFAKKYGIENNVVFTGDITNPFIPITICNVFMHILFIDGTSLALLEAMSLGKPIIASTTVGFHDAIHNMENGILVKPEVDAVKVAIKLFIENKPLADKLGMNAKAHVERYFSWQIAVEKYLKLFNS